MNLIKQVDTEESEQKDKGKVVRVPSLKRKTSDKRNTPPKVTEIKSTAPLPSVPLPSLSLRSPLETIFSPIEKSPSTFQQFIAGGDPKVLSSNKTETRPERRLSEIITQPTPRTVGPRTTSVESRSSLSSPLSPTPTSQQRSSSLSESYATGLLSPQEKSARGSAFSNQQTKLMATPPEPHQKSLNKSPNLLLSNSSQEKLESTSSVSHRDSWLSPCETAILCLLKEGNKVLYEIHKQQYTVGISVDTLMGPNSKEHFMCS